ncbi:hypothetical protein DEA98_28585 (plasmid) [Brucella pseudogrignonensis]|nr:hypothetical protein [Brucella pseudogrignonensis]
MAEDRSLSAAIFVTCLGFVGFADARLIASLDFRDERKRVLTENLNWPAGFGCRLINWRKRRPVFWQNAIGVFMVLVLLKVVARNRVARIRQ